MTTKLEAWSFPDRIGRYLPDLVIDHLEVNTDGLMNDVLIVNQERIFRFAKDQAWIRFDLPLGRITGVLDFGVAGIGDPAHDFGVLLNCYGESFVRRMARFTPEIGDLIDRARFMSLVAEPSWVLRGLRSKDPFWFTVSLGTARDVQPIGSRWAGTI